ncbi:MAG: hypothetical protein GY803_22125 [Chloroflexi bacterium]|nr:hypothetical protein [Chloroflexota bacterium]
MACHPYAVPTPIATVDIEIEMSPTEEPEMEATAVFRSQSGGGQTWQPMNEGLDCF